MKLRPTRAKNSRSQGGYILVLMVFMTAMLVVTTLVVGLSIKTEAKRQKEEEMIWRGKQYIRGIKLYYKKTGRYPTSLDDLTKGNGPGNIHFMRQAYKDPMNKDDGSWRLLYVGANGQLIGSLKPPTANSLLPQSGGLGTSAAAISTAPGSQQPGSTAPQNASGAQTGATTGAAPATSDGSNSATAGSDSSSNPQSIAPADTPTIIGGNIVGVGSKVNEKSIIVYEKAKNYKLFEFYWDASKDLQAAAQGAGLQLGNGLQNGTGQQPTTNPFSPQQGNPPSGGPAPTTGAPPNAPAPSSQP